MPSSGKRKILIAHIPVLHRGYLQLFKAYPEYRTLYIVGPDILKAFDYLRKDLRALEPAEVAEIIKPQDWFDEVKVLGSKHLPALNTAQNHIVMPEEDVSQHILGKLTKAKTELYPIFLRWDRRSSEKNNPTNLIKKITATKLQAKFMQKAAKASLSSSDIWRRVGAVLQTKNGKTTIVSSNRGEPSPHSPWMEGDPRNALNKGIGIEMSVFTHAEAALIAEAARRGVILEGARLYCTTFPCPACAKLIAHSGVAECYFLEGYGVLDGQRIMEDYGVKVVQLDMGTPDTTHPDTWVPYKKA
jgi:dCMP deaminase